jgi:muramidase (phage lysozyme)/uncharacterized protein YvpB
MTISSQCNALLDVIAYAEGTDRQFGERVGYNIMFSYQIFANFQDHPRKIITAETPSGTMSSTAAGRYQLTVETWDSCQKNLNLDSFNPGNQDKAAMFLIERHGALNDINANNLRAACEKLSWQWKSLPYDDLKHGRFGMATLTMQEIEVIYGKRLAYYQQPNSTEGINLPVPYLSQRDNKRDPDSTCNVTCVAMVIKYFQNRGLQLPNYNLAGTQLEDQLDQYMKQNNLNRYVHKDLVKVQQAYGLKSKFTTEATWEEVKQHLLARNPVIISGQFTPPGHIIVLRGFDNTGFWVNDPYGEWWSRGYDRNTFGIFDNKGENKHYSYDLCSKVSYTGPNRTWAHFPSM